MLVISRKAGDQLVIGDDIIVTVVKVEGDKVRIGIDAPSEVPVNRDEIQARKDAEIKTGGLEKGVADIPTSGNSEGPGSSYQPKLLYNKY
ncbi:MAG: Carbon storage regulator [archaeon]|jgi:carbon storage regulator